MHTPPALLLSALALSLGLCACGSGSSTVPSSGATADDAAIDVTTDGMLDGVLDEAATADTSGGPIVSTDKGPVRGLAAGAGGVFLGIPYAAPPVGTRRLRATAPHEPWTATVDATKLGPACPQGPEALTKKPVLYSEDCLTLNVWTPSLGSAAKAPVMVFIHGGSFVSGSANLALYNGALLAKKGVVVVSLNYRLGALGFMAHTALGAEDAHQSSGDFGILDQQQALRWVQSNVEKFGGDASNVTIFGESAGAISVCAQVASPLAKGLFSRAIGQSGSCALIMLQLHDPLTPTVEDSAEERGQRAAASMGCMGPDVAGCLREKSVEAFVGLAGGPTDFTPGVGFGPNIDGWAIPTNPHARLRLGLTNDVPYLVGSNGDEATIFTAGFTITTDAEYRAALYLFAGPYSAALYGIFPPSEYASPKDAFDHMWRDVVFTCPARATARAVSTRVARTYLYHFTHVTAVGATYKLGSFHAAELPFVFGNFVPALGPATPFERTLSDKMMTMWTTFAKTGEPGEDFPQSTTATDTSYSFSDSPGASTHVEQAKCDALAKIFPL